MRCMKRHVDGDTGGMRSPLAASAPTVILVSIAVLSVVVLVLIVVAPWKQVREEPPLDKDVEARLLLHRATPRSPPARSRRPRSPISPITRIGPGVDADFAELRDLDD